MNPFLRRLLEIDSPTYVGLSHLKGSRFLCLRLDPTHGPSTYELLESPSDDPRKIEDLLAESGWKTGAFDLVRWWHHPGNIHLLRTSITHDFMKNPYEGRMFPIGLPGYESETLPPLHLSDGLGFSSENLVERVSRSGWFSWALKIGYRGGPPRMSTFPGFPTEGKWWKIAASFDAPVDDGRQTIFEFSPMRVKIFSFTTWCSVSDSDFEKVKNRIGKIQ
jgi:hypothetical protein